ncbi:LysR family transcriptional regulator [Tessaracoccus caeni]|uniref:LysR family transcriptional regulator n=1 Tax=Tessaracoccus caeni TaxID=3031239 RepID=UPI0023DC7CD5|nr:LysR family transcriptional regulator [Tessaracoccus caeni]MDF1487609.1 LysR family transcriptional regulator [Tessaracoccus caeni]
MSNRLPNLQALALFLAVVDEGSLGAGARKMGMYQPNASRMIAQLEAEAGAPLLKRHPRGSRPTSTGLLFAAHARRLLDAADEFSDWLHHSHDHDVIELQVGASMTIAEHLLPAWLAELRRAEPRVRVEVHVHNSAQVINETLDGTLQLGLVETPNLPPTLNTAPLRQDELALVVAPHHPWAARSDGIALEELATTPLIVREGGSGTRNAFEELMNGLPLAEPTQVLGSNAAVRVAVAAGAGPAVLSVLAVRTQLSTGELRRVPLRNTALRRPLTAIWKGPRRLRGAPAHLLTIATKHPGRL